MNKVAKNNRLFNFFRVVFLRIKTEVLDHRVHWALVLTFVVVGGWWRFYRLPYTLLFQADQGRDALIVADIWRKSDPVFIGPVTSVGNMYLGPFYYYFMLPWLWLSYPSPLGPAVAVAAINTLLIVAMYVLGQRMVGRDAALIASGLTAGSRILITYSRFSWNPNLSAPVAFLTLYWTYRAYTSKPREWWVVALLSGILIQLHYVNLIVVAVAGLFWLGQLLAHRRDRVWRDTNHWWQTTLIALAVFAFTLIPLTLFDWKHGFVNLKALGSIFSKESSFADRRDGILLPALRETTGRLGHLVGTLTWPNFDSYAFRVWSGRLTLVALAVYCWKKRHDNNITSRLLITTLLVSVIALAFYRHSVYDHYVIYFWPTLALIWGTLLTAARRRRVRVALATIFVLSFVGGNYQPGFFREAGGSIYQQQLTVEAIAERLPENETYNLALVGGSQDHYAQSYRFFIQNLRPNLVSPENSDQADHLFVIDEDGDINIFKESVFEIDTYPNQEILEVFYPADKRVKIYHLRKKS